MIRASCSKSSLACNHVAGINVDHRLRNYRVSTPARKVSSRRRSAQLPNPFSSKFAKYFQGALWTYIAAAALITVVNNIHW